LGFAAFNEIKHGTINIYKNLGDPLYLAVIITYLVDIRITITKNSTNILTDINNIFILLLCGFK